MLFTGIRMFSATISRPATVNLTEGEYHLTGIIEDYTPTNYGDKAVVRLTSLQAPGKAPIDVRNVKALVTFQNAGVFSYGDFIVGTARLKPFDAPGNYLKKDYENYLERKHILLTGFTSKEFTLAKSNEWHFKQIRDLLEANIEKTGLHPSTKSFLISFLLGDKTYITGDDRLVFTDAGVAHMFAVSGFHVSLVAALMLALLSVGFDWWRFRRWKFLAVLPLIWAYIALTGFSPATCRAGMMLTIGMAALFLERKNDALKSLAWAVILILSLNADALFDIGFQLSVVCVGSLIAIAQPLNFIDHRSHPRLFAITATVLVALTASLSSWMICAFYFHRFSLMFLPLNLMAVPLLPPFIAVALIYLAFCGAGFESRILGKAIDEGYRWLHEGAEFLASQTQAFDNLHPDWPSVILWLIGIGTLAYFMKKRTTGRKKAMVAACAASVLLAGAVITFAILPATTPQGFIIQKGSEETALLSYENGRERTVKLKATSIVQLNGKKIMTASSENLPPEAPLADYIIIRQGCKNLPSDLPSGAVIVTHPSLHWRYERRMISQAKERGIHLHSLRYDGPLHVFD